MILRDLQFVIYPMQLVEIDYFNQRTEMTEQRLCKWYQVSGLDREVINILAVKDLLVIEVTRPIKNDNNDEGETLGESSHYHCEDVPTGENNE